MVKKVASHNIIQITNLVLFAILYYVTFMVKIGLNADSTLVDLLD